MPSCNDISGKARHPGPSCFCLSLPAQHTAHFLNKLGLSKQQSCPGGRLLSPPSKRFQAQPAPCCSSCPSAEHSGINCDTTSPAKVDVVGLNSTCLLTNLKPSQQ